MKNYIRTVIFFMAGITIFNSCGEETSPEIESLLYQLPGCQSHSNSLLKIQNELTDSCFAFTFTDKLIIDFCVSGNCCPDSSRFEISSRILQDTITIAVSDTAQHLCRCICNYIIHGEFESLSLNKYYVKCILQGDNEILYLTTVKR